MPKPGSSRGPAEGIEVELRDGSWACIRSIRPEDREVLRRGFERLSDDSRYRRFLTPMQRLSEGQLSYLTEIDHHGHEAVIALDLASSGEAVGVGRYVREDGSDRAEAAVTVIDEWQGRGLGVALTRILAGRAAQEGITHFTATLLAGNDPMVALLEQLGSVEVTGREGDTVEVTVPLAPEVTGDPALRGVLRAVATTRIDLARPPGED